MDEIRIKDLTSAAGQLGEFDKFEFIVDVPTADASMRVSGAEIKGVMAPKRHTHAMSDVTGLDGELAKKLDKKGGAITGDLSVMGDTYLRRLHLEEFLEVPEFQYNRIETVVGDKWSARCARTTSAWASSSTQRWRSRAGTPKTRTIRSATAPMPVSRPVTSA